MSYSYRQWKVRRAFAMLCKCIKWRMETKVIDLIQLGDEGLCKRDSHYVEQLNARKSFAVGLTDDLIPIISVKVARHIGKAQSADTMTNFVIATAESFRSLMIYPNDKVIIIFDMTGFSMKNMDWHSLMTIMSILEAYYPETLSKLYIYGAPWIFQGIWKAVSPLLDPNVRAKICFASKNTDFDQIPMNRLEKTYGGNLVDAVEYVPTQPGENKTLPCDHPERKKAWDVYIKQAKEMEKLTESWIDTDGQDDHINEERDIQAKRIRLAFLEIEPLVRGKNFYHRAGIIHPENYQHWTYKQSDGKVIEHIVGKEFSRPALEQFCSQHNKQSNDVPQSQYDQFTSQTQFQQMPQENYGAPNTYTGSNAFAASAGGTAIGAGAGLAGARGHAASLESQKQTLQPSSNSWYGSVNETASLPNTDLSYLQTSRSANLGQRSHSSDAISITSGEEAFVDADDGLEHKEASEAQQMSGRRERHGREEIIYADYDETGFHYPSERDVVGQDDNEQSPEANPDEMAQAEGGDAILSKGEARPIQGEYSKLAGFTDPSKRSSQPYEHIAQSGEQGGSEAAVDTASKAGKDEKDPRQLIAESNERMRYPTELKAKQPKKGIFSRLNCCGGKGVET